jgi:hypothetical protein
MKPIPYPGDLNPIELAVWSAEYVRARAARMYDAQPPEPLRANDVDLAIDSANYAVKDLRLACARAGNISL